MKKYIKKVLRISFSKIFGVGATRNWLSSQRKMILEQAFRYTRNELVEGDYIEFGVARGRSIILAYFANEKFKSKSGQSTKLFGFDSFEGFPKPEGIDSIFKRFKEGEEDHGGEKIVIDNIKRYGIDLKKVKLVKGWYNEILNQQLLNKLNISKARVINVDCDMYNSTLIALKFITPKLQNGTVILFDDWLCYRADPEKGEQRAVNEWLNENQNIELIPYRSYANVGQSFIVNLKNS